MFGDVDGRLVLGWPLLNDTAIVGSGKPVWLSNARILRKMKDRRRQGAFELDGLWRECDEPY